jgi:maltokinase
VTEHLDSSTAMTDQLHEYMEHKRWFAGKGRGFRVTGSVRLPVTAAVAVELVSVAYDDPSTGSAQAAETDLYQVPLSYYAEEQQDLEHAHVGHWDDETLGPVHAYDAVHDHEAMRLWLAGFAGQPAPDSAVTFRRVGDPEIDTDARSALMSAEQSNSSVAFGEDSLMKLFRRITPGVNPDVEILTALTLADNEHVPALLGYVEANPTGPGELDEPVQLGILQQFLRTASDGWDLALVSLRNLYADADMPAHLAGGDFAGEARRLGIAVGEIHGSLAQSFPTRTWGPDELDALADAMLRRLDDATGVVPQLAELDTPLRALLGAVRDVPGPVRVQRIHGDLHLGQTLRTVKGWKIIDFEGEPAKSLEERRRPDSVWRDVAGMVRSFDYAAELTKRDHVEATGDADHMDSPHAREWAERNLAAFLTGYDEATEVPVDRVLLTAYAVDKAVYEAVYEARNRPAWLPIPMAALRRLADRQSG